MTTEASISPLLSAFRRQLAANRSERRARRTLRHELAGYSSESDRQELDAILARHTPSETAEIRQLIG